MNELPATDGQRNMQAFYTFYSSTAAPMKSRLRYDDIEWMPVAEHKEQANLAAERLMQVMAECTRLKTEAANMSDDYAVLNAELLTVREERTNAQIERDQCRVLLGRVLAVDEVCTGEAYAALIADLRKAIGATQK